MKPAVRAFVTLVSSAVALAACQPVPASTPTAQVCAERPSCSFQPDPTAIPDPLQQQLGCGQQYRYVNGGKGGDNGLGSFCPDSPKARSLLHAREKHGYLAGYCQSCLGVPPGKLFVFWKQFAQPSCPSGCPPGAPPL